MATDTRNLEIVCGGGTNLRLPADFPLFYGHHHDQLSPLELLTELEELIDFLNGQDRP